MVLKLLRDALHGGSTVQEHRDQFKGSFNLLSKNGFSKHELSIEVKPTKDKGKFKRYAMSLCPLDISSGPRELRPFCTALK